MFKHQRVAAIREMRGKMWSPGRPSTFRREDRVRFWAAIARGVSTDDCCARGGDVIRGRGEVVPGSWRCVTMSVADRVGPLSVLR